MQVVPSGEQWEIRYGSGQNAARAVVVEVGGGLRECEIGGGPALNSYPLTAMCDGAHNTPLIPWPNRLKDGKYSFDGHDYQVALTEPKQHNAIHGFLRWRNWTVREREESRIMVGTVLHPLKGYPFILNVSVEYVLDDAGLTARTTAVNMGDTPCPYGCGQHPYLTAGTEKIDELTLELKAESWLPTGPQQIPTGKAKVAGSPYDFRGGRKIGEQKIDYAFTDLTRDGDGRAWAKVTSPAGRRVGLWVNEHFHYLEIYTGDTLAPGRQRRGLGVEPMTCPPNGFATGEQVIRLEPGESVTTSWGVVG
jgi:aldose 1-epimerase